MYQVVWRTDSKCYWNTTYFQNEGHSYQQTEGAAMGSPVSPIVANLFMEEFETRALSTYQNPPRFWGCYVDDVLAIIKRSEVDNFLSHINVLHPVIKFTIERESEGMIPMLDVSIIRCHSGELKFKVYQKCKARHHQIMNVQCLEALCWFLYDGLHIWHII